MEPVSLALILGASAASSAASVYNNRQNIKYAQEANDETIGLANTAHQREVRDLLAAGLNPILSATGSGAATPSLRTPNLESVDGGIANNASGLARAVSNQQRLENESLAIDNSLQELEAKRRHELYEPELNSALASARMEGEKADFERELFSDKISALHGYKYKYYDPVGGVSILNNDYLKDVADSVKADVKRSGTEYLQGWSNHVKGWVDTGIDAFNSAKGFGSRRLHNLILKKRLERLR